VDISTPKSAQEDKAQDGKLMLHVYTVLRLQETKMGIGFSNATKMDISHK
jgi:hypothetical protein